MNGSLRERRPGVWTLRVYIGGGKQVSKTVYTGKRSGKREAQAQLRLFRDEVGQVGSGAGGHVGDLLDAWLEQLPAAGRAPKTIREASRTVTSVLRPELGDTRLVSLKVTEIDRLVRTLYGRGLSPATIRRYLACLSAALNQGVRWGWLPANPVLLASRPRVNPVQINPPDVPSLQRALECAVRLDPLRGEAMTLAALTGLRRGEICGLQWQDYGPGEKTLLIARSIDDGPGGPTAKPLKQGGFRSIALPDAAVCCLSKQPFSENTSYIFPLRPSQLTDFCARVSRDAGQKITFHMLRHWHATQLGRVVSQRTIQTRLGHSRSSTTDRYAHAVPASDVEAARAMDQLWGDGNG